MVKKSNYPKELWPGATAKGVKWLCSLAKATIENKGKKDLYEKAKPKKGDHV